MAIWYILWPFGIFYGHLVYFMAIWYIVWSLWYIFPVLVCSDKKNLATLLQMSSNAKIELLPILIFNAMPGLGHWVEATTTSKWKRKKSDLIPWETFGKEDIGIL
jgi:hypothetical protein